MRNSGQSGSFWKRSTRACAVARLAVEVLVGDALARRAALAAIARKLVNCEKTSALCPSSSDLGELRQRARRAWRSARRARAGSIRPGMAGRLAQPQQRLEHLDLRLGRCPSRSTAPSSDCAVVVAQLVVELALRRPPARSRASARSSRGQLRRDLLLGAAQDERPQRARRAAARSRRLARPSPASRWKAGARAEHARDSGTRRGSRARRGGSRPACRSAPGGARARSRRAALADCGVGVLDRLRLVEDDVVELDVRRASATSRRSVP